MGAITRAPRRPGVVLHTVHTLFAREPTIGQEVERLGRQHDIAVLAALGLLDANDLLRTVDMFDLQPDQLAGAQPAAIAKTEQKAGLEAAGDGSRRFVSSVLITSGIF
jgi:hypothetical protein